MTCHAGWLYILCCGFVGTPVLCPTQAGIFLSLSIGSCEPNFRARMQPSLFPGGVVKPTLSPTIVLHPVEYRVSGYCVRPVLAQNWNGIELHRIGI